MRLTFLADPDAARLQIYAAGESETFLAVTCQHLLELRLDIHAVVCVLHVMGKGNSGFKATHARAVVQSSARVSLYVVTSRGRIH